MRTYIGWGALAGLLVSAGPATAGLLPVHVGVANEGANYRYTYSILLESDSVLKAGDYFTIYDFAGLAGGNAQPTDFAYSSLSIGPTPAHLLPGDDPNVSNLTWTYTGAEAAVGQLGLGDFSALSRYGTTREDDFTGQTHREVDGHLNGNVTDTNVPVPVMDPCHVPEPSSLVLLGIAACGVALRRKRQ